MTEAERTGLESGVRALMALHETEPVHVLHVRDLALLLFDGLARVHGLGAEDRILLDAAARLHDIGWAVTQPDGKGHHKASARLIREHGWVGVRPGLVALLALVARYHRKAIPEEKDHEEYAAVGRTDRRRVCWLGGLLRVADGLDRRHIQAVTGLEVEVSWVGGPRGVVEGIRIEVAGPGEVGVEVDGALRKVDLLERTSGVGVWIGTRRGGATGP